MTRTAILAIAAVLSMPAIAAPCRNQAGKFIKCDAAGAKPTGAAAAQGNISKDKNGRCHIVKPAPGQKAGQFAPCPK